jgi:hypothetical protein
VGQPGADVLEKDYAKMEEIRAAYRHKEVCMGQWSRSL